MAMGSAPFRRTYLCRYAGNSAAPMHLRRHVNLIRRKCCDKAMYNLIHEQTVAATQLTPEKRVKWIAAGGY